MKLLTSKKRYICDLTIGELLNEYRAVTNKNNDDFGIYLSIPQESTKKQEYVEKLEEQYEWRKTLAFEIADRLTKF